MSAWPAPQQATPAYQHYNCALQQITVYTETQRDDPPEEELRQCQSHKHLQSIQKACRLVKSFAAWRGLCLDNACFPFLVQSWWTEVSMSF